MKITLTEDEVKLMAMCLQKESTAALIASADDSAPDGKRAMAREIRRQAEALMAKLLEAAK